MDISSSILGAVGGPNGESKPGVNENPEISQRHADITRLQNEISVIENKIVELQLRNKTPGDIGHGNIPGDPMIYKDEPYSYKSNLEYGQSPGLCPDRFVTRRKTNHGPFMSTPKRDDHVYPNTDHNLRPTSENITGDHKYQPAQTKNPGVKIKPATFDGSGSWTDYKAHFDVCAELNKWTDREKGLYLAVSLRGQAQGVFGNLANKSSDYNELSKALEERFAPPHQTELYRSQLRDRRQKAPDSLSELGQDIRRLANMAYPTAPTEVRETLAKEQFIDALVSSDMRLRIKQSRPASLNEAIQHAVELEAFNRAERKHIEHQNYTRSTGEPRTDPETNLRQDVEALQKSIPDIQKTMKSMP